MRFLKGFGAAVLSLAGGVFLSSCLVAGTVYARGYADPEQYRIGNFEYDAEEVDCVAVNWYCGSVTVRESDAAKLQVSESGTDLADGERMHWYLDGNTLRVEFCESGYIGGFLSRDKRLTIEIPSGIDLAVETTSAGIKAEISNLKELELLSTSGTIEVGEVEATDISLRSTSGSIHAEKLTAESVAVMTTSGEVKLGAVSAAETVRLQSTSGSVRSEEIRSGDSVAIGTNSGTIRVESLWSGNLGAESTSGSITVGILECTDARVESTSGSVKLTLGQNLGATLTVSSTSGSFSGSGYRFENGCYIYGDGACDITVRTTSGSVTVR